MAVAPVSSLYNVITESASAVPASVTGDELTVVVEFVKIGAAGAAVSSVITKAPDFADTFSAASVAVAVKLLRSSASVTPANSKIPPVAVAVATKVSSLYNVQ